MMILDQDQVSFDENNSLQGGATFSLTHSLTHSLTSRPGEFDENTGLQGGGLATFSLRPALHYLLFII